MKIKNTAPGENPPATKKKVLIIDDHIVVRQGLMYVINREEDFEVCGDTDDARKGLALLDTLKPDVVLVDISLPGINGIEFVKNARASHSGLPVVVLSMHDESLYAERALRAGALGYVMKKADSTEIITALRKALDGELYTSGKVGAALLQRYLGRSNHGHGPHISALSDRELEVFELIGHGKTTREIAVALGLSVKTVDSHRMHIKEKLGIASAPELVKRASHYVETEAGAGQNG